MPSWKAGHGIWTQVANIPDLNYDHWDIPSRYHEPHHAPRCPQRWAIPSRCHHVLWGLGMSVGATMGLKDRYLNFVFCIATLSWFALGANQDSVSNWVPRDSSWDFVWVPHQFVGDVIDGTCTRNLNRVVVGSITILGGWQWVVIVDNGAWQAWGSTSASGLVVKSNVAIVGPRVRFSARAFFIMCTTIIDHKYYYYFL